MKEGGKEYWGWGSGGADAKGLLKKTPLLVCWLGGKEKRTA